MPMENQLAHTYGMFNQLKPKCIAEAIINLTVSLLFCWADEDGHIWGSAWHICK